MNKVIIAMLTVLVLGISTAWAQEANVPNSSQISSTQPVEVGNKHCPVTGRQVGEMGPVVKHLYNSKIYNLCCPMCHQTFDSDPEKYAKIAENEAVSNTH